MKTPQPVLPYSPDSFKVSHYLFHNKIRSHTFILNQKILRELKFWFALINANCQSMKQKATFFFQLLNRNCWFLKEQNFVKCSQACFVPFLMSSSYDWLSINETKNNIFLPIVKQQLLILERIEFCQMQSGLFCSLFNVFVVWRDLVYYYLETSSSGI